jgi:hypothetical protein
MAKDSFSSNAPLEGAIWGAHSVDPPSAQAHMPSRPSGADKEKERAQNEGSRGFGLRRPLDRADILARRHGFQIRSSLTVKLADSGKVRVNRR